MKKIALVFLFFLCCYAGHCQNTFSKQFTVNNIHTSGLKVVPAANGNYYVLSTNNFNCLISEFTPGGDELWTKSYVNTDSTFHWPELISLGHHGLLLMFNNASFQANLIFLDTLGNLVQVLRNDSVSPYLITYSEADSSIYFTGASWALFGITIVKMDLDGNTIWTRLIDDSFNSLLGISQLYVTGRKELLFLGTGGSWQSHDFITLLLDSVANPIRSWHFQDQLLNGNSSLEIRATALLPGNRLLAFAYTRDSNFNEVTYFLKTDSMGNLADWARYDLPMPRSIELLAVTVKNDSYCFGGIFIDSTSYGSCLLTLDTLLNFQNLQVIFDTTIMEAYGLAGMCDDGQDGLMLTGQSRYRTDSINSTFLVRTDTMNNTACSFPAFPLSHAAIIIHDTLTSAFVDSSLSYIFYRDDNYIQVSTVSYEDENLCEPSGILPVAAGKSFSLYPNPVSEVMTVRCVDALSKPLHYVIADLAGQELRKGFLKNVEEKIDTRLFSPGLYLFIIDGPQGSEVRKFVKHQ